ncbi:MAG: HIT domain-containing protein [Anaerolineaceae bacterium]|nr:HIT domain-containing protein [Anaerolineaceae bacterium]
MKTIWSPWRMEYIENHESKDECVFCRELALHDGPANLIVSRGRSAFVILNRYPYTSGHLMVVPLEHTANLDALSPETRAEMIELVTQAMGVLRAVYHPDGFNMGANIGEAAGAGVAAHVHLHLVPRWAGDTNFMSTVGDTRVLPENLEDTFLRIKQAWQTD